MRTTRGLVRWRMALRWAAPVVAVVLASLQLACAANWAQLSGFKLQNVVVPQRAGFSPRWGHGMGALENAGPEPLDESLPAQTEPSRLFVVGGDDFDQHTGGGGYRNDVWYTTGARWRTYSNRVQGNKWGDPLAKQVSRINWFQSAAMLVPPEGVTYRGWIRCTLPARFRPPPTCTPAQRAAVVRWSPRRNHAVVVYNNRLLVLGGRTRKLADVPAGWEQVHGGFVGPRLRWREETVLVNDVWSSPDGVQWSIVNPGCDVPHRQLIFRNGTAASRCAALADCYGDAYCEPALAGACVCNAWAAREQHGAAVHAGGIFVVGGFAQVQRQQCGPYACGGGYRVPLRDVWRSGDGGVSWSLLLADAPWQPRAAHGVVTAHDWLWLFGGVTGSLDTPHLNPKLRDVWRSLDGVSWEVVTPAAPWAPRSHFAAVVHNSSLVMLGGETEAGVTAEVWTSEDGVGWEVDYGEYTVQRLYATPTSPVTLLQTISEEEAEAMAAEGITTITELSQATYEQLRRLQQGVVPRVCVHRDRAVLVVDKCSVEPDWVDGAGSTEVPIETSGRQRPAPEPEDGVREEEDPYADPCAPEPDPLKRPAVDPPPPEDLNGGDVNITCRWRPAPRRALAAAVFGGLLYATAGEQAGQVLANDAWYRDAELPRAAFAERPDDRSSSLLFRFACSEPGCVYEYHLTHHPAGDLIRNWTLVEREVVLSFLRGGAYQLKVRAIDPAGNTDVLFLEGENMHTWQYVPALPWFLIISLSILFILIVVGVVMEWRRRAKRRAMERYAMKRMRRKFKGIQRDAARKEVDWRQYYEEAKLSEADALAVGADGKKKKKSKKGKEKKEKKEKKGKKSKKGKGGGGESEAEAAGAAAAEAPTAKRKVKRKERGEGRAAERGRKKEQEKGKGKGKRSKSRSRGPKQ